MTTRSEPFYVPPDPREIGPGAMVRRLARGADLDPLDKAPAPTPGAREGAYLAPFAGLVVDLVC